MLRDVFWSGVQVRGLGSVLESLMHMMSGAGCFNGEGAWLLGRQPGWMNSRRASVVRILGRKGHGVTSASGRSNIRRFCPPPWPAPTATFRRPSADKVPGLGCEIRQLPRGPG